MIQLSIRATFLISLFFSINLFPAASKKDSGKTVVKKSRVVRKAKTDSGFAGAAKNNAGDRKAAPHTQFDPEYARRAIDFLIADMRGTIADEIEAALQDVKKKHERLRLDPSLDKMQYDSLQAQALGICEKAIEKCKMLEKAWPQFAANHIAIFELLKHQCTPLGNLKIIETRVGDTQGRNNGEHHAADASEQFAQDDTRALVQGGEHARTLLERFKENPQRMCKLNHRGWSSLMLLAAQGHQQVLEDCLKIMVERDYKKNNEVYKKLPREFVAIITYDKSIDGNPWDEFDVLRVSAAEQSALSAAQCAGVANQAQGKTMPPVANGAAAACAAPAATPQYPYLTSRHHFANSQWFRPFMCQDYLASKQDAESIKQEMREGRPTAVVLSGLGAYLFVKHLHASAQTNLCIDQLDSTADKERFQKGHAEYQAGLRVRLHEALTVRSPAPSAEGVAAGSSAGMPVELIGSFLETDCPYVPRLAASPANVPAAALASANS